MDLSMGVIERKFAELIWQNEPVSSSELVKLGLEKLDWKRSTAFTVLKRLCEKGIFQNDKGTVTSLISREEYDGLQSQRFVEERFHGSLPAFVAAFTAGKPLQKEELAELRQLLEKFEEG